VILTTLLSDHSSRSKKMVTVQYVTVACLQSSLRLCHRWVTI